MVFFFEKAMLGTSLGAVTVCPPFNASQIGKWALGLFLLPSLRVVFICTYTHACRWEAGQQMVKKLLIKVIL